MVDRRVRVPRIEPGDGLLHPVPLLAIVLLILNDHVLKAAIPGLVTGKLSDLTGLVFFPLGIVSAIELGLVALGRWSGPSSRLLLVAVIMTGAGFVAVKLLPEANSLYRVGLGQIQAAPQRLGEFLGGAPAVAHPVSLVMDPTDLIALLMLPVVVVVGFRRCRRFQALAVVR